MSLDAVLESLKDAHSNTGKRARSSQETDAKSLLQSAAESLDYWSKFLASKLTPTQARALLLKISLTTQETVADLSSRFALSPAATAARWATACVSRLIPGYLAGSMATLRTPELAPADFAETMRQAGSQAAYFDGFRKDVQAGKVVTLDTEPNGTKIAARGFLARVRLYGAAVWSIGQNTEMAHYRREGYRLYRRVLGAVESCQACIREAARGWVSLADRRNPLSPIGTLTCLSRCHCTFEYRK